MQEVREGGSEGQTKQGLKGSATTKKKRVLRERDIKR